VLILDRSVEATPEGLIVDPYCVDRAGGVHGFAVVSPSGNVAGSPAPVHVIARLDEMTPDHACPKHGTELKKKISKNLVSQ
jgi:hypothetical protein